MLLLDQLLILLSIIEDIGGLKEVKSTDGNAPQVKLVLDKQTYDVVQNQLSGFLTIDSETKSHGLCFTIEHGDIT